MRVTGRLAAFAAELEFVDVPEDLRERMKMALLDAIGIMLGAVHFARLNGDRELATYLEETATGGPSTVIGHSCRTTPMLAAFLNGTLCEVLDFQDCNLTARIHNGAAVTPAVLAIAESNRASGQELLTAMLAGFEIGARLGQAVQPAHWDSGFQISGTFNTCAAAAAAGRMLGLGPGFLEAAVGVSGFVMPVSCGDTVFKGHSVKPIHAGQAAMCGIESAYLAKAGYCASPLEGESPRFHSPLHILGRRDPDLESIVEGLGEQWATRELAFKPYPIGLLIIGPVQILLEQFAGRLPAPEDVDSISVRSYEAAAKFTGGKYTTVNSNYVDAHLSIPYCLAAALSDREMGLRQLTPERLGDPRIHELARRITVREDAAMTARFPREWPVSIKISCKDGSVLRGRVDQVKWSPRRPPTWDELGAKFLDLAIPVIGKIPAGNVVAGIANLESLEDLSPLMTDARG